MNGNRSPVRSASQKRRRGRERAVGGLVRADPARPAAGRTGPAGRVAGGRGLLRGRRGHRAGHLRGAHCDPRGHRPDRRARHHQPVQPPSGRYRGGHRHIGGAGPGPGDARPGRGWKPGARTSRHGSRAPLHRAAGDVRAQPAAAGRRDGGGGVPALVPTRHSGADRGGRQGSTSPAAGGRALRLRDPVGRTSRGAARLRREDPVVGLGRDRVVGLSGLQRHRAAPGAAPLLLHGGGRPRRGANGRRPRRRDHRRGPPPDAGRSDGRRGQAPARRPGGPLRPGRRPRGDLSSHRRVA